jgi:hypothetical protein
MKNAIAQTQVPVIELSPKMTSATDWTLTGFLLILTLATIFKGIPAMWGMYRGLANKKDELIDKLIEWQRESTENLEKAINSLKDLHQDELELLRDIRRDINHDKH